MAQAFQLSGNESHLFMRWLSRSQNRCQIPLFVDGFMFFRDLNDDFKII